MDDAALLVPSDDEDDCEIPNPPAPAPNVPFETSKGGTEDETTSDEEDADSSEAEVETNEPPRYPREYTCTSAQMEDADEEEDGEDGEEGWESGNDEFTKEAEEEEETLETNALVPPTSATRPPSPAVCSDDGSSVEEEPTWSVARFSDKSAAVSNSLEDREDEARENGPVINDVLTSMGKGRSASVPSESDAVSSGVDLPTVDIDYARQITWVVRDGGKTNDYYTLNPLCFVHACFSDYDTGEACPPISISASVFKEANSKRGHNSRDLLSKFQGRLLSQMIIVRLCAERSKEPNMERSAPPTPTRYTGYIPVEIEGNPHDKDVAEIKSGLPANSTLLWPLDPSVVKTLFKSSKSPLPKSLIPTRSVNNFVVPSAKSEFNLEMETNGRSNFNLITTRSSSKKRVQIVSKSSKLDAKRCRSAAALEAEQSEVPDALCPDTGPPVALQSAPRSAAANAEASESGSTETAVSVIAPAAPAFSASTEIENVRLQDGGDVSSCWTSGQKKVSLSSRAESYSVFPSADGVWDHCLCIATDKKATKMDVSVTYHFE